MEVKARNKKNKNIFFDLSHTHYPSVKQYVEEMGYKESENESKAIVV